MHRLGNKDQARKLAKQAGVPVVPGSDGLIQNEEEALRFAKAVGFPVLIKARRPAAAAWRGCGGGFRDEPSLRSPRPQTPPAARPRAAFKDGSVYLERYIDRPRHVEVQLFGDRQGNVVHLWERECSLQRRHQKLVEESPSPHLPDAVRNDICASAVRLARTAGYQNAGTCEFLVDKQNNFYFIEVNSRIQVEHPVTELVTGLPDLVKEQIRVAAGEPLSFRQEDVTHRGAAMECRINAEDPEADFRPSPGVVTRWQPAGGPGVRLDSHVTTGYRIPPNYDSLIAKLLVWRPTRAEALATMRRALAEFGVDGVKTTIPRLREIFDHPDFIAGKVDTTFIERTWPKG